MVSIILPVFNGEKYMEECLESLWAQSFTNFECIVINDGSTDNTQAILRTQRDRRLKIISQDTQGGICKALNLGIDFARGHYIARMDADDICHPERLKRQVEFLDRHKEIGFCGTWVRRFTDGEPSQVDARPTGFQRIRAFSVFDNPFVHSSVMLRTELFQRHDFRYREDFAGAEDYELWTRLMNTTKCENIPVALLDYRVHPHSVTFSKNEIMDELSCRILDRGLRHLGLNSTNEEVLQHRLWSTGRLNGNAENELERVEDWLKRLISVNKDMRVHDVAAFLWAVRKIWFALCYRVQSLGKPVLNHYFQSVISRTDIKHNIILSGAILKRRLSRMSCMFSS